MNCRNRREKALLDDLTHLSRLMATIGKRIEAQVGLTWHQLMAVRLIEGTSPKTVGELSAAMMIHPASMGALLDRLEARRLVRRFRDRLDRRVVHVELTEAGRELGASFPGLAASILFGKVDTSEENVPDISRSVEAIAKALAIEVGAEHHFPHADGGGMENPAET